MRNFTTLWRREIAACWNNPMGYILAAIFLTTTGSRFIRGIVASMEVGKPVSVVHSLLDISSSFILPSTILVIVGLTMRLLSEEKKSGTIELLMTAPVTDAEVIGSKFAGALFNFTLILTPTLLFPLILQHYSANLDVPQTSILFCAYLFIMLLASFYTSLGLLISALTSNQVIAAISTLCAITAATILPVLVLERTQHTALRAFTSYLDPSLQMKPFLNGSIDSQPIVLYTTLTLFCLFVSTRLLEMRKWK